MGKSTHYSNPNKSKSLRYFVNQIKSNLLATCLMSNQIKSSFFQINQIKSTVHLDNWLVGKIDKMIPIMSSSVANQLQKMKELSIHLKIAKYYLEQYQLYSPVNDLLDFFDGNPNQIHWYSKSNQIKSCHFQICHK